MHRARRIALSAWVVVGGVAVFVTVATPAKAFLRDTWWLGWPLAFGFAASTAMFWGVAAASARREIQRLRRQIADMPVLEPSKPRLEDGKPGSPLSLGRAWIQDQPDEGEVRLLPVSNPSGLRITDLRVTSLHPDVEIAEEVISLRPMQYHASEGPDGEWYEDRDKEPFIDANFLGFKFVNDAGERPSHWRVRLSYTATWTGCEDLPVTVE
jgi:hypothetical protein